MANSPTDPARASDCPIWRLRPAELEPTVAGQLRAVRLSIQKVEAGTGGLKQVETFFCVGLAVATRSQEICVTFTHLHSTGKTVKKNQSFIVLFCVQLS